MNCFLKYTQFTLFIILAVLMLSFTVNAATDTPKKILILPFKINASQDLTYIQEGLSDMLSSRLSWEGRVIVLDRFLARKAFDAAQGEFNNRSAREAGRALNADYVVFGSITMIGQNVSLDAAIISQIGDKPPITVSSQTKDLNGVMPQINSFAEKINSEIFQRGSEPVFTEKQTSAPSYRRHPESLLKTEPGKPGSAFVSGLSISNEGFWRSPSLPIAVIAVDVGDVDGDKAMEVVYASSNKIFVARLEHGQFRQIALFKGRKTDNFITLDVADINGNGRAEIFVNNHNGEVSSSFVLEWVNHRLVPIVQGSSWFYRIINLAAGPALIGQESIFDKLFYGSVQKMAAAGGGYVPRGALNLPQKMINALNFSLARFPGEEQDVLMLIDGEERLHILDSAGKPLWEGEEEFGGSIVSIPFSESVEEMKSQTQLTIRPFYVPPRILVADADGDGDTEVLIAKADKSSFSNFLSRYRRLKSGAVYSLSYGQLSLKKNWRTPDLSGYPVDYQVKDIDNDGSPELVIAVIFKSGDFVFSKARSGIVAYQLKTFKKDNTAK